MLHVCYIYGFRECDSINSKENIQAGYRNGTRIVNWECVNKTSLNYGADTNLSFIITYEIPRLYLNEFNRKYPGRLQKRTLKNGSQNCKQQLFTLTMCLSACLWAQIAKIPFNYTITAQTHLAKCDQHRFQRLVFQFPALGKKYLMAGMFIITRALRTPRDVERRESGSMFCETVETISWSSNESSRKHENIALKSTMT